eukprot:scaffold201662_cov19-Tisochrysis_lutea.AAC.3
MAHSLKQPKQRFKPLLRTASSSPSSNISHCCAQPQAAITATAAYSLKQHPSSYLHHAVLKAKISQVETGARIFIKALELPHSPTGSPPALCPLQHRVTVIAGHWLTLVSRASAHFWAPSCALSAMAHRQLINSPCCTLAGKACLLTWAPTGAPSATAGRPLAPACPML